jgi:Holliday junction resolvase RusA-like endonuclease
MAIRTRSRSPAPPREHAFAVEGSPVSVNRYGTAHYRNWRADVHAASVRGASWSGSLFTTARSATIRYFRYRDGIKDVDNILKAILDGLDGKGSPAGGPRVMSNDRLIERVVSQRTNLRIHNGIDARRCHRLELDALIKARRAQAAVFVQVSVPPDHLGGVSS